MKYTFFLIFSLISVLTYGQQANRLLENAFWQAKPNAEAVKAEVSKGANAAEFNANSFDPVVLAINAGAPNDAILYLLGQKGNDVNKITHDSRTYLHWAASKGNTEIVNYLLANGAKVDVVDSHGMTPLNFAVGAGQPDLTIYDQLISKGAKVKTDLSNDGANALLLGIGNDPDFKLTEYFVSKGLDLKSKDAAGNTAFDYAARSGSIKVMNILLGKGVSPTQNAMIMAAQGTRRGPNGIGIFNYLDSLGVKPTATSGAGENVLHAIVRRPGQAELVKFFLAKGVNPNQADNEGNTPFMNAAAAGKDTVVMDLLLTKVKDINQVNRKGLSALAMAVRSNTIAIIQYLLSKGADVKTTDAEGNNLVYYVIQSYSPRNADEFDGKMKLLAGNGINPSAAQKDGNTLYHLAVAKNDLALVKKIESFNADVNAKNNEGLTPLHKAAMIAKDDSILKYLLSIGAKRELTTTFSETAFDLSQENEYLTGKKISTDFLK